MRNQLNFRSLLSFAALAAAAVFGSASSQCVAQDEGPTLSLGDGKITLQAPKEWKKEQPRSRILQYEFSAPASAKEDEGKARITVMAAGGSIDANIDRWYGQFKQPSGKATKDVAKTEKFDVAGQTVHWVDISGTFEESMGGGPFAPGRKVERAGYRMIGAILVGADRRQYFFKMTGPEKVVDELDEGFKKMLKALKAG